MSSIEENDVPRRPKTHPSSKECQDCTARLSIGYIGLAVIVIVTAIGWLLLAG